MSDKAASVIDAALLRVRDHFALLAAGGEISAASRYRLEGHLQALIDLGVLDEAAVDSAIAVSITAAGFDVEDFPLGEPDIDEAGRSGVCLPVVMKRAPVLPSTRS